MKAIKTWQVLDAKRLLSFAASFAATVACAATSWNNPNGGDMAMANNWTNGLPAGGNSATIAIPVSGPLTLSENLNTTGAGDCVVGIRTNITFDLGAEHTLTATRTSVYPNSVVTLASGTWRVSDRFFVGDNYSDATFIVDGANSALYANSYFQVGSSSDNASYTSKNNLLIVRNGGLLQGCVVVGRLATAGNELCGTNTLHVTGTGSRFISSSELWMGCNQGLSQGIIDDHATATLTSNVSLGKSFDNKYAGDLNRLLVSGGASLTATGSAYVGHTASASNLFEVADGATATVTNLYSSYASNANVRGGRAPFGNRVVARGEGSRLVVDSTAWLGYVRGSHDDSMLIANGASFAANTVFLGYYGHSSHLTVDGGVFTAQNKLTVGSATSASNCVFEVLNGATVTIGRFIFADHAPNCTAVISNATLNVVGTDGYYLDIAFSDDSPNMKFVVAGRNGKVRVGGGVRIKNASAKIAFHIPAEGFAETPFVGNFSQVYEGATIEVTADEDWPCGSRQTLMEPPNGSFWGQANNLTIVCNDDRLRVIRESDKIYVKKLGGFVITFR